MRPSELLQRHRTEVRQIALRRGVHQVKVFGSVLRGADIEGSDLDLLVEPGALPEPFRARVLAEAMPL